MHSAIYKGVVRHRRFHPRHHEFSYAATLFYLDLAELPELFHGIWGWSYNRANLGSFRRADYLGDPNQDLAEAVRSEALRLTGSCPTGAIRLLTGLRIWGFCFNPVSFYYLFDEGSEHPALVLAQVNNTPWNERHTYAVVCDATSAKTAQVFPKRFHVSPFNPLVMDYHWRSTSPAAQLLVHMENHQPDATAPAGSLRHMDATLSLHQQTWSRSRLHKILWLQPWLAIKVPLAIYWQALKLWFKGVPVYDHDALLYEYTAKAEPRPCVTADKPGIYRANIRLEPHKTEQKP